MTVHDNKTFRRDTEMYCVMHCIAQYIIQLLACDVENKGVKNSPRESDLLAKSLAAVYHPPPVLHEHHSLK